VADLLDTAVESGLTLVTGGVGWGKTTTVAAWAARRGAGWLTLRRADHSARRLADKLLTEARRRRPDLPRRLAVTGWARQRRAPGQVGMLVDALVEVLTHHVHDELVVVLDGLDRLRPDHASTELVSEVCRRRPPGLRLVLVTRQPSARWCTSGLVPYQIGPDLLAFTEDEVAVVLKAVVGRTDAAQAGEVWSLTAGWPAAVCLVAEALRAAGPTSGQALAQLRRTGVPALDALAAQALKGEPEPARRLLTTAALLGTVDAGLARALGHEDAAAAAPVLVRQGLLCPDGPDASSWSVVPPVGHLLVRDGAAAAARELHVQAAAYRRGQRQHGQALRHLIAADDQSAVEQLLADQGETLIKMGETATVAAAANVLGLRSTSPQALTVLGHALQVQGDWLAALAHLEAAAGTGPPEPAVALRLGQLYFLSGRTDLAVEVFERACPDETVGEAASADEVRLLGSGAIWLRAAGQDERARVAAMRAAKAAQRAGDLAVEAHSHRTLALLAAHHGDRPANELHHQRALRLAVELGDDPLRQTLLINRASYLAEEGSPAQALETADAALRLGADTGPLGYEPFGYSIRGRAKARLGLLDEALADVDVAQQLWGEIGPSLDVAFGLLVRGEVHRRRGEPGQAQAAVEEALRWTTDTAGMQPLRALVVATLSRVRAADDLPGARALAEQAVALASGTGKVPAMLARGWVALLSGERQLAAECAAQARAVAGARRDHGGLAEAIELAVLSAPRPAQVAGQLDEAVALWDELGDPIGSARARLVAAQLTGISGQPAAEAAVAVLRSHGVRLGSGVADALAVPAARPAVTVYLLGGFRVLRAGEPVQASQWRSRKARDLFKILVLRRGQPLSRERLMDLLWPDEPAQRAANRLSVLLTTVRTVLDPDHALPEPGPVLANRDTVAVDPALVESDLDSFRASADAALAADRRGDPDAARLLAAAETACTGELLPEDPDAEWAQPERDRVRTTHIALLRALTRHAASPEQREHYLLQQLRHDPYDEQSHRQLVHVLRTAGRHGEARHRYQEYLRRMAEIGITVNHPRPP